MPQESMHDGTLGVVSCHDPGDKSRSHQVQLEELGACRVPGFIMRVICRMGWIAQNGLMLWEGISFSGWLWRDRE